MYYECSYKFSSHLPITVSISCSSCSSTSGCCLSSSSMKKRLMDRVSGAAITISSTHCLTFSADSSPWFWKRTHVDVWVRGSAEHLQKRKGVYSILKPTCANMSSAVKLMLSSLSACSISLLFCSTRLSMASCSSWLWDNTLYLIVKHNSAKTLTYVRRRCMKWLTLQPCASGESSRTWSKCLVWSAQSAKCQNTSGSSAAALSLDTESLTKQWWDKFSVTSLTQTKCDWSNFPDNYIYWFTTYNDNMNYAYSPSTGVSRNSLLEMSTTVQRSKLRTSTWSKTSRLSRWVCVEETQISTVCCRLGPVRADGEQYKGLWLESNDWINHYGRFERLKLYLWWNRCVSFSTGSRCC